MGGLRMSGGAWERMVRGSKMGGGAWECVVGVIGCHGPAQACIGHCGLHWPELARWTLHMINFISVNEIEKKNLPLGILVIVHHPCPPLSCHVCHMSCIVIVCVWLVSGVLWDCHVVTLIGNKDRLPFDGPQLTVQSFPVGSGPVSVFFRFIGLDLQTLHVPWTTATYFEPQHYVCTAFRCVFFKFLPFSDHLDPPAHLLTLQHPILTHWHLVAIHQHPFQPTSTLLPPTNTHPESLAPPWTHQHLLSTHTPFPLTFHSPTPLWTYHPKRTYEQLYVCFIFYLPPETCVQAIIHACLFYFHFLALEMHVQIIHVFLIFLVYIIFIPSVRVMVYHSIFIFSCIMYCTQYMDELPV